MYLPKHFEETRVEVLHGLVRAHPLGALVTLGADGLEANHIPFEIDSDPAPFGTLRGHVARANPVWRELSRGADALAIFQGAATYVSPSWYPTKQEGGKVVPTWNYAVVHARGKARLVEPEALPALLARLTRKYEEGRPAPWRMQDLPADFTPKLLAAIVGFEIAVERLEGKFKLSQNRRPADLEGVIAALEREGQGALAALVREHADRPPESR